MGSAAKQAAKKKAEEEAGWQSAGKRRSHGRKNKAPTPEPVVPKQRRGTPAQVAADLDVLVRKVRGVPFYSKIFGAPAEHGKQSGVSLMVASSAVARIIGVEGTNVNAIRDATLAFIEVQKLGGKFSPPERLVTVRGNVDSVQNAVMMFDLMLHDGSLAIEEVIRQVACKNSLTASSSIAVPGQPVALPGVVAAAKRPPATPRPAPKAAPPAVAVPRRSPPNIWEQRAALRSQLQKQPSPPAAPAAPIVEPPGAGPLVAGTDAWPSIAAATEQTVAVPMDAEAHRLFLALTTTDEPPPPQAQPQTMIKRFVSPLGTMDVEVSERMPMPKIPPPDPDQLSPLEYVVAMEEENERTVGYRPLMFKPPKPLTPPSSPRKSRFPSPGPNSFPTGEGLRPERILPFDTMEEARALMPELFKIKITEQASSSSISGPTSLTPPSSDGQDFWEDLALAGLGQPVPPPVNQLTPASQPTTPFDPPPGFEHHAAFGQQHHAFHHHTVSNHQARFNEQPRFNEQTRFNEQAFFNHHQSEFFHQQPPNYGHHAAFHPHAAFNQRPVYNQHPAYPHPAFAQQTPFHQSPVFNYPPPPMGQYLPPNHHHQQQQQQHFYGHQSPFDYYEPPPQPQEEYFDEELYADAMEYFEIKRQERIREALNPSGVWAKPPNFKPPTMAQVLDCYGDGPHRR